MGSNRGIEGEGWARGMLILIALIVLSYLVPERKGTPWWKFTGKVVLRLSVLGLAGFGLWSLLT